MVSIVRICFAFVLIAAASLASSGCSGNSSASPPATTQSTTTQGSPTNSAGTSGALAISGQPATVAAVDAEYSFRPETAGAAGQTLTFTVQNAPAWASFDPATGTLSGKPSAADVGTYSHVSIGVNDGTANAQLAAFSITVTATGMAPITLSWIEPTTNTNGTPSTDLAGYHVYYGASDKALTRVVAVNRADVTSYVFNNLAAGTWYFAVAAFNKEKIESTLSAVVKHTL